MIIIEWFGKCSNRLDKFLYFHILSDHPTLYSLQNCIANHESNGLDIITALILNDINPLGKNRMDLVLKLKVRESYVTCIMYWIVKFHSLGTELTLSDRAWVSPLKMKEQVLSGIFW